MSNTKKDLLNILKRLRSHFTGSSAPRRLSDAFKMPGDPEKWELVSNKFTISKLPKGTGPNKTNDLASLLLHEKSITGFVKLNGWTIGPSLGLYVNKLQFEGPDENNLFNIPPGICNGLLTVDSFEFPKDAPHGIEIFKGLTLRQVIIKSVIKYEADNAVKADKNKMLAGDTYIQRMYATVLCFWREIDSNTLEIKVTYLYDDVDLHNDLINDGWKCGLLDYMEFESNMYCKLYPVDVAFPFDDEEMKNGRFINPDSAIVLFDYSNIKDLKGTNNTLFKNISGVVKIAKTIKDNNLIRNYYAD